MKAIFFSDIHFHIWPKYNEELRRTKYQLSVFKKLVKIAYKKKVPLFFGGDLFHQPVSLDNELLSLILPFFRRTLTWFPIDFYAITGNHDVSKINRIDKRSPSYINTLGNMFKSFNVLDFSSVTFNGVTVYGVPYIHFNEGLMDYINGIEINKETFNILLLHTDFKGQEDTNGIVVGKGEGIDEKGLSRFDLVVSGHVHKPGKLRRNIYSIGAPMEQRVSDMGGEFGYWILEDSNKLSFKPLEGPRFRYYTKESEIDNDTDFWIKVPKESIEGESQLSLDLDLSNRKKIAFDYLKSQGITSKSKLRLLLNLISEIDD